ncbi:hypothetical protein DUI87_02014 [Hirundo rustica rustica]|uniref:Uncharacterized protein n=1 Tax=Hirundo rustica rustica TaxID=333673 RepID=A0A3M0L863_HIRRU|nr:hypothetical protein DUI87_02014 [Hirundo rustica rustica]
MSSKSAVESGGTPPGTAPATPSMSPETAVRNVVNIARSQSQQSCWTSSNNDLIVTGIYSPASSSGQPRATKHTNASVAKLHKTSIPRLPGKSDADFQQQHIPLGRQVPHCKNTSLLVGEKTIILSRQTSMLNSANSIYSHTKKSYGGSSVPTAELVLPQKPMICYRPCKAEPLGCQRLQKPKHTALASHVPPRPRAHPRDPACGTQNLEIREVFSLAVTDQPQRLMAGSTTQKHPSQEGSCLSIAMETGDVDDEYAREEELASMGAQIQSYSRYCEGSGSSRSGFQETLLCLGLQVVPEKEQSLTFQGNQRNALDSNKLQDRTQFSDRDLATLKKYWDNGMTSLGSVCREKIEAVAAELNVDCEIVRRVKLLLVFQGLTLFSERWSCSPLVAPGHDTPPGQYSDT